LPSHPLTHHEILTLVEPFTRKGRHPDLLATNRLERRLVFKPVELPVDMQGVSALTETLRLDSPNADAYVLSRMLVCVTDGEDKLEARLEIEGKDPADLLASVDSIAPESQFRFGPGFKIAKSYRLIRGSGSTLSGAPAVQKILSQMSAHISDFVITATAPTLKVDPEAVIEIQPTAGEYKKLPDDLLAVLGWDWGLISKRREGWKSILKLRGREPERSRKAESKLDRMVEHLAQTFAEAPARFHERLVAARWSVVLRRAMPLLIGLGLIGGAAASSKFAIPDDSPIRMMMMNLPGLLMVFLFCRRRLPVIEVPPIPRALTAPAWRESPASGVGLARAASTHQPLTNGEECPETR
jgi:hypothetical protein